MGLVSSQFSSEKEDYMPFITVLIEFPYYQLKNNSHPTQNIGKFRKHFHKHLMIILDFTI